MIRSKRSKDSWLLSFTGRDANDPLMEDIMDHVENLLSPNA